MDEKDKRLESLIKVAPFAVIAICFLIFIAMSQIPPSGQWVKDSVAPVLPTLKYNHINESWGRNYKREDAQPAPPVTSEILGPPPRGMPKDDKETPHSYYASPRMLSARNAYHDQSPALNINQAPAAANTQPDNTAPTEDLLHPNYMTDNEAVYEPAFGNARGVVKTQ